MVEQMQKEQIITDNITINETEKKCTKSFKKLNILKLNANSLAVKVTLWIILLIVITAAPVMMKLSFYSASKHAYIKDKYTAPTTHALSFFTSFFIGLIISGIMGGKKRIIETFNFKSILLQAPVSMGYAVSEALALYAMKGMDPIMYSVIHKIRLIETAFFTKVVLRRRVSLLSWVVCFAVTMCVLGFVLMAVNQTNDSQQNKVQMYMGALLLFANISISVLCSIYADWCYKKLPHPYTVQMSQGRITACLGSLILVIAIFTKDKLWKYGYFGGVGGGWDLYTILFFIFLMSRDWVTSWVLKNLDALWKALAGSAAVATTFVVDALMMKKNVVPSQVCLVMAIVFCVSVYALQKQQERKMDEITKSEAELKKKLEKLAGGNPDAWRAIDNQIKTTI